MRRNNIVYRIIFKTAGMLFSIAPVTIAILSYFPIWIGGGGGKVLSGFTVLLCALAHVPLLKGLKKLFESPASYTVWLVMLIAFLVLSNIAHEMTVISLIGFISNALGAVMFKLADKFPLEGERKDEERI